MILGYALHANASNDGLFFDGNEPAGVLCQQCGSCRDYRYAPASIDVHPSKKYDVASTHDLRMLFSARFVDYCRTVLRSDDGFSLVKCANMDMFYLFPSRVIEFDVERRKTRFEGRCSICGGYESVTGAYPAFLRSRQPLGPGFHRADVAFASGKSKFPPIFVGAEWKALLASQKFRGLAFEEVQD